MHDEDFYTFNEYMRKENESLTASMEDYLEMIFRLSRETGFTRIHELASALNVQPPSATKMVQKLSELKLLNYEKYGIILLTENGKNMGEMLLRRHNTIENFLKILGVFEGLLEETEKIEHTISRKTVERIEDFTVFINSRPELIKEFFDYCSQKENRNKK